MRETHCFVFMYIFLVNNDSLVYQVLVEKKKSYQVLTNSKIVHSMNHDIMNHFFEKNVGSLFLCK